MPYVMTLKEGDDFYVNHTRFVVREIVNRAAFSILRESDGEIVQMVENETYSIAPLTSASVGLRGTTTVASVAVSAPQSVAIDPGVSYRSKSGHHSH